MRRQAKATSAGSIDGSGKRRGLLIAALAVVASLAFGASTAFAAAPTLSVDPGPTGAYTTAEVSGHLDPADNEVFYWFQYAVDPDAEGWSNGPQAFSRVKGPNTGDEAVSEELTGLKPGTEYRVRLLAFKTDFSGEEWASEAPYETFTTEPVTAPTAVLDSVTAHTDTTAQLSVHVNPNAPAGPLSPAAEAAYETPWHLTCTPECPNFIVPGGTIQASEGEQSFTPEATGLEPNTTYEVTLEASNAGGPDTDTQTFATDLILPTVKSAPGAPDGKGGYTLQGVVNPHNSAITTCEFEYGLSAAYGQSVPCTTNPGPVNKSVEVTAPLSGLTPGAEYHFNLIATNGAGEEEGGDTIFTPTQGQAKACPNEALRAENNSLALPDCRAYEMVTPPDKGGYPAELGGFSEGNSVLYGSIAGNIAHSGQGIAGGLNLYVTNRTDAGWQTISDLNGPTGSLYGPPYELYGGNSSKPVSYSSDLQSSIWFTEPGGTGANRVYLRNPDGSFTLVGGNGIGDGKSPALSIVSPNQLIGTSSDLSHVVLGGIAETFGAGLNEVYGPGVYEFVGTDNVQPRRVDVDNAGNALSTCALPEAFGAVARGKAVSSDGRVIVSEVAGGCGGANPPANEVWARVDGTTSFNASASRCTRGDCNAPADAHFQGAAEDGSRIYLTTTEQLVNGDTDEFSDLYACDIPSGSPAPSGAANSCSSLTQISGTASGANVDEDVPVVSDDGSTVYFVARGVLATNPGTLGEAAVPGDYNLYLWRQDADHPNGQTTFVDRLDSIDLGHGAFRAARAHVTASGRYLVFSTASQLVASDTDNARDVYRYDADTGTLVRLSTNVFGVGGNADGFDVVIGGGHVMSDDGDSVVFQTSEALSPLDGNGEPDVYLWKGGRVFLISTGTVGGEIYSASAPSIDSSGQDIYFNTAQQLIPGDGDAVTDVYDARVGGGFSADLPAQPCSGETCQPAASGSSPSSTPLTSQPPANPGNVKPCPRGKVAKGTRCIKKHKKHHRTTHKKKSRVGHDRGGSK